MLTETKTDFRVMRNTVLIKNGIIITLGSYNRVLRDHAILCENGVIKKVAPVASFEGTYPKTVDAGNKVVMPGFINSHMHFYSTFACGISGVRPSANFNEVLENLWWRLDKKLTAEDCYYSAAITLLNAIRHGTTTIIDHHASPFAIRGSLDAIAEAVKKTGLRASLCYEVSDRDGEEIASEGIEENVDFIKRCSMENDPRIKALFGLHASFTLGDKTLDRAGEIGNSLGAGFHIHCAEAESDQLRTISEHRLRVVERLYRHGILGEKSIAAHCVHVNQKEMELLKETGTAVAHNPQSNMNNAVGTADLISMIGRGVVVGLGTDAMTVNMLEELRACLLGQRLAHRNPSAGFNEAVSALTVNNAKIANRYWETPLGEIREGFAADIILIDYDPPTPLNEGNFPGHLVFGLPQSQVDTTICAGEVLMENRELKIDVDEKELRAKSRELADALWKRF